MTTVVGLLGKKGDEAATSSQKCDGANSIWFGLTGGAHSGVVVKTLCYKPAGRGFDSRWRLWNFSVT